MATYKKDRSAFKWRASFNRTVDEVLPNGTKMSVNKEEFSRWVAMHDASATYIQTLEGFDRRSDIVIAVNAIYKDKISFDFDFDIYTVTLRGVDYIIRMVMPDEQTSPEGYHLLYLRRKDYQTNGR